MKAVLISIKPKWCELITSRKKTIEVRKTRPKLKPPFKCYIYETKGKSDVPTWMDEDGHASYECGGKVIGEFVCGKIEAKPFGNGIAAYYSNNVGTCVSDLELRLYQTAGKPLYFWHISDLKIYDEPKGLTKTWAIARPPQSWCYVEEDAK